MHELYCMDGKKTDHEMVPGLGTQKKGCKNFVVRLNPVACAIVNLGPFVAGVVYPVYMRRVILQ